MGTSHTVSFSAGQDGWMGRTSLGTEVSIGAAQGKVRPYDLLLLALASCLNATFEEVCQKMKLTWERVDLTVSGEKRDEVPTTLKHCSINAAVTGGSDKEKLTRAFDIASRYCSVYQTVQQVAHMEWSITFSS